MSRQSATHSKVPLVIPLLNVRIQYCIPFSVEVSRAHTYIYKPTLCIKHQINLCLLVIQV